MCMTQGQASLLAALDPGLHQVQPLPKRSNRISFYIWVLKGVGQGAQIPYFSNFVSNPIPSGKNAWPYHIPNDLNTIFPV